MGKGSRDRTGNVRKYQENWERIFRSKKSKSKPVEEREADMENEEARQVEISPEIRNGDSD